LEPTVPPPRFRRGDPLPPAPEAYESVLATTEKPPERRWLHLLLFLLTVVTTVWAGGTLVGRELLYAEFGWGLFLWDGARYAFPLLLFLTVHEFGHYFAARIRGIDVTLPYYIPFPLPFLQPNIGTFGAVIRIREPLRRTGQLFDIGAAGPLAGFVVALGVLIYALATLPPPEYVYGLGGHESLKLFVDRFGAFPDQPLPDGGLGRLTIGQTPLYWALTQFFPDVPPMYEMYHYPVLFAGWLGLFFTALNMLPVGQLDGGHILYALAGPKWHGRVARAFVIVLLFSATLGLVAETGPLLRDLALYGGYPEALGGAGVWVIAAGLNYFFFRRLFEERRVAVGGLFALVVASAVALRIGGVAEAIGYSGWFFWCLLIVTLIKVDHPPVTHPEPLTPGRRALGILALTLLVLCFSFKPLYIA
jgi:membrane-associated protease RseP (regulator of RpoE activity)